MQLNGTRNVVGSPRWSLNKQILPSNNLIQAPITKYGVADDVLIGAIEMKREMVWLYMPLHHFLPCNEYYYQYCSFHEQATYLIMRAIE